jgi:methylated-DNA-protein-cysteine methyltransferase related protein
VTPADDPTLPRPSGERFRDRVLRIVRSVPPGRVVTYGQVALLAGAPRAARQVGGVLYGSREHDAIPWQRVVNASGGISTYKVGAGELQEALLRAEGVEVGPSGVDLRRYGWDPGTTDASGSVAAVGSDDPAA